MLGSASESCANYAKLRASAGLAATITAKPLPDRRRAKRAAIPTTDRTIETMSYRLTKAQQALMTPGNCTACGVYCPTDRNSAGECMDCHNAGCARRAAERKAQLAAMPRCEVPGCKRRATWIVGPRVELCGIHKRRAERRHNATAATMGGLALFMPVNYSREELLEAATD